MESLNKLFSVNYYKRSVKTREKIYKLLVKNSCDEFSLDYSIESGEGKTEEKAEFTAKKSFRKAGVSFIFEVDGWSKENYVFAPAALYNGNRFRSLKKKYPPMLTEDEGERFKNEVVITDVPRLSREESSRAQLNIGDLSAPCFGYFSESENKGYLVFFEQKSIKGNFGLTAEEADGKIRFIISAPCVREKTRYGMNSTSIKSHDEGADFKKGEKITFKFSEYSFECKSPAELLNKFFELRTEQGLKRTFPNKASWHYVYRLLEEKYNTLNWLEDPGFYISSVGAMRPYGQWQTGWVGGAMDILPGFIIGNETAKEHAFKTLDFVFDKIQHKSGFLYGIYFDDTIYGDEFYNIDKKEVVMSRKNADAFYFLTKELHYLKENGYEVKPKWENGLKALADAFVSFYKNNGELAQFINMETGKPVVYGSASAGIAPAALSLYGKYFDGQEYIEIAEKLADHYYKNYVLKGFSNGGPGEITACPDSESAFGLLEGFITLYGVTENEKYLKFAEDAASLCSTWCVSYDYDFGKYTQFSQRNVASSGAVWASVQNKHAAPGICTLSGTSLFLLYRATGNIKYLELCRDIAHNLTQYISVPENPTYISCMYSDKKHTEKAKKRLALKAEKILEKYNSEQPRSEKTVRKYNKLFNPIGHINERVNLSDWEGKNNVGELPQGSCWCETSMMLTFLEVPGIYVNKDAGFCFALDHVECKLNGDLLEITNPTGNDTEYRVFIETLSESNKPICNMSEFNFKTVKVQAGENVSIKL